MMRITLDIDEGTADVYVAGIKVGTTYNIGTIKDIAELRITTGNEERIERCLSMLHEAVASTSEELMEKFFEEGDLTEAEIKKAIRKAFENSLAGKGSSLVEIVSTCSSGWKLTPVKANEWMEENMFKYYQLGDLKDKE